MIAHKLILITALLGPTALVGQSPDERGRRRMIRSILVGSLLALVFMSPSLSQVLPELGTRVRITTGTERLTGTLSAIHADELTIELDRIEVYLREIGFARATSRSGERSVATSEVTKIEVRQGNYAGRGALYGFLVGAAAGAVLVLATPAPAGGSPPGEKEYYAPRIGVLFGVLGIPIGAVIGSYVVGWSETSLEQLSIGLGAHSSGGYSVSVSVSF